MPRLHLTPVTTDDAAALHRFKNDEELQLLSSDVFVPEELAQTRARLERWLASDPNDIVHFAIRLSVTGAMIGFCHLAQLDRGNLSCKVGIVLGERQLWGQGLGTKALGLLVEKAFEQELTRVGAEVHASNLRSIRMLERAGFEREGALRRSVRRGRGAWEDELLYAKLAPGRAG